MSVTTHEYSLQLLLASFLHKAQNLTAFGLYFLSLKNPIWGVSLLMCVCVCVLFTDYSLRNGLLIFFLLVLPILVLVVFGFLYIFRRDSLKRCFMARRSTRQRYFKISNHNQKEEINCADKSVSHKVNFISIQHLHIENLWSWLILSHNRERINQHLLTSQSPEFHGTVVLHYLTVERALVTPYLGLNSDLICLEQIRTSRLEAVCEV